MLHQVPLKEKQRILADARKAIATDGSLYIADYGLQRGVQRLLFRSTVQALDGVEDTQPNADGIIQLLLNEAEFSSISEDRRIETPTGTITLYRARQ